MTRSSSSGGTAGTQVQRLFANAHIVPWGGHDMMPPTGRGTTAALIHKET
jgi:hypothetical protein